MRNIAVAVCLMTILVLSVITLAVQAPVPMSSGITIVSVTNGDDSQTLTITVPKVIVTNIATAGADITVKINELVNQLNADAATIQYSNAVAAAQALQAVGATAAVASALSTTVQQLQTACTANNIACPSIGITGSTGPTGPTGNKR